MQLKVTTMAVVKLTKVGLFWYCLKKSQIFAIITFEPGGAQKTTAYQFMSTFHPKTLLLHKFQ